MEADSNVPRPDERGASHGARFLDSLPETSSGDMATLIRAYDWADNPLGPPADWPPSLRAMVRMALSTRHPVFIFWGPDHICLYNDAYKASLGPEKHPAILGMRGEFAWPESWSVIGPQVRQVIEGHGATWHENQLLPILRNGALQDGYWTYSFGPIDDERAPSGVGGVLVLVTETTQQVRTEKHQAAERNRLAQLFEQAPTYMALVEGPDHICRLVNPSYQRLVGQRAVVGRPIREALPELVEQGHVALLDTVLRTGETITVPQSKFNLAPGNASGERHVDFVLQPILDGQGRVTGVFIIGADITERRLAEQALLLSEEQLRLATEAAEIGLWDVDLVADRLYWPARVKAMFGISEHEPVSMADYYNGLHPLDREATTEAFARAIDPEARALYDVEYRTVGKEDGRVRWVAAKGRGIFNERGQCVRVIGTAIDISSRKAAEEHLRELNETLERRVAESLAERRLLAEVVEGTNAFVQVVGLDFRWLAINKASADEFFRIFGIRPKVGDNMLELLAHKPEQQDAVRAIWNRALAGENFITIQEFGDPLLDRRHYEMHFSSLRDRSGALIGAYQFVYDVTDRLREQAKLASVEAALRQAQKMQAVGQLTGGIAHDFNNLLQAMRGSFELVRRHASASDAIRSLAAKGLAVSDRAAKLTAQLLTFSREQSFEIRPFSARRQIESMQHMLRSTVGPTMRLTVDLDDDEFWVSADATQFEMAILNLAINARDVMDGDGEISIGLRRVDLTHDPELPSGEYVQLSVTDTGPGMSPEVAARAFDPFFTTKAVGKGSGLGLSQVYGMAQRVGGSARIDTQQGRGTTVRLYFRCAPAEAAEGRRHDDEPGPSSDTLKLLVVDDDDDVRSVLVASLKTLGHAVIEAPDGRAGLQALAHHVVDVLVVDFAMSEMNGAEVAKLARQHRPDLPVLFVSGYSETAAIVGAGGIDIPMLRKPFDMPSLAAALRDAVAAQRSPPPRFARNLSSGP
ncbi:MAG: PAS domain-containing protein [Pseudomonadota bacterium]|nr:PAS domain-containing protein [Pseudomonadota bacterium]